MDNVANFKGVMLCNRPAPVTTVMSTSEPAYDSGKQPFVSTVMPAEQLGANPIKRNLPGRDRKNPADDVTWRHKKWLAEFQERREDLTEMMEEASLEQEMKQKRFQEKQAAMRAAIRKVKEEKPGDREALQAAMNGDLSILEDNKMSKTEKVAKKKKAPSKPKWALTSEENENVEEFEVDDLLDFTENLDFEKYMDDLEVKEAMTFVQDRVKELAEPKKYAEGEEGEEGEGDEDDDLGEMTTLADPAVAAKLRRRAARKEAGDENWENDSQASGMSEMSQASTMSKALLQNNQKMRGVHSNASVKAMLEKQGQNLAVTEPKVATTKDRSMGTEVDPSHLPYLFRSPQV